MVILTRDERRKRVLELHNQSIGTRGIAELLHMSFTDIAKILKEADKEKESEQQRTQQEYLSSRAYKLFSQGKSPVEVAIELNIRAPEAILLQKEYWDLVGLHHLNQIYKEIKVDPWPLVNLYKSTRSAGMNTSDILTLLKVANNDLPGVEKRYNSLKQEIKSLQKQKVNLYNQVTIQSNELEYYQARCQQEKASFDALQERRQKAEALARYFENNDQEYIKIRKTVEEKVNATLSDGKPFIQLALFCLIELIKTNPDKYSPLINENRPPKSFSVPPYYAEPYGQQLHPNYFEAKSVLAEEAAKMYKVLSRDLADKIIKDYTISDPLQPSLSLFPSNIEKKSEYSNEKS